MWAPSFGGAFFDVVCKSEMMEPGKEVMRNVDKRLAVVGIIVEEADCAEEVNEILHEFREYIVGRMGIPYREREVSVISIIVDAPNNVISAMSGKLGMVHGVTSKAVYATK